MNHESATPTPEPAEAETAAMTPVDRAEAPMEQPTEAETVAMTPVDRTEVLEAQGDVPVDQAPWPERDTDAQENQPTEALVAVQNPTEAMPAADQPAAEQPAAASRPDVFAGATGAAASAGVAATATASSSTASSRSRRAARTSRAAVVLTIIAGAVAFVLALVSWGGMFSVSNLVLVGLGCVLFTVAGLVTLLRSRSVPTMMLGWIVALVLLFAPLLVGAAASSGEHMATSVAFAAIGLWVSGAAVVALVMACLGIYLQARKPA